MSLGASCALVTPWVAQQSPLRSRSSFLVQSWQSNRTSQGYRWTLGGARFPESLETQNLRTGGASFRSTFQLENIIWVNLSPTVSLLIGTQSHLGCLWRWGAHGMKATRSGTTWKLSRRKEAFFYFLVGKSFHALKPWRSYLSRHVGSLAGKLSSESHVCHALAMWLWRSHSASLSLRCRLQNRDDTY